MRQQNRIRTPSLWRMGLALVLVSSAASKLCPPFVLAEDPVPVDRVLYEGIGPPWNEGRYVGQWIDGTTMQGDEVAPWDETEASPALAGRPLFSVEHPIRWLLDTFAPETPRPKSFVEFVGGDRLPGRVIGFSDGLQTAGRRLPAHLIVAPYLDTSLPHDAGPATIRVATEWVRRIVWTSADIGPRPETVVLLDGRQLGYRSLRFSENSARILREDGIHEFPFTDLAEVSLAETDFWNAHLDQVAALCPMKGSRLMRLEASTGLRATSSMERFQARSIGDRKRPDHWHHLCQPAWSLDPLWVRHTDIRLRSYFLPYEVPLSAIRPTAIRQDSAFGGSWLPQTDRNTHGGPLACGGRWYPWGFGVHASCELEFPLPECICRFRTALGLDQIAGSGGCVRGRVKLSSASDSPIYQSETLVGSHEIVECPPTLIRPPRSPGTTLVLQVDAVCEERPEGADPFDIRDDVDWLQPLLEVDPGWLRNEIVRRGPARIPAWKDWAAASDASDAVRLVNYWDESAEGFPAYRLLVAPEADELRITANLTVRPKLDQLLIAVTSPPDCGRSQLEVLVDGNSAGQFDVPGRRGQREPEPLAVSLVDHKSQQVAVELIQRVVEPPGTVDWRAIRLADSEEPPGESR